MYKPSIPQPSTPHSLIHAELTGSARCSALGISIRAYAPVCALARQLIRAGLHPEAVLEVYRGAILCFRTRLAVAARLTVADGSDGVPRLRPYDPPNGDVGDGIAKTRSAATSGPTAAATVMAEEARP